MKTKHDSLEMIGLGHAHVLAHMRWPLWWRSGLHGTPEPAEAPRPTSPTDTLNSKS